MRVVWTLSAEQDRSDIFEFIARDNPLAAIDIDELFSAAVARLVEHPLIGRAGKIPGTRELILLQSYRLIYEVQAGTIWILALVHTARLWPPARP